MATGGHIAQAAIYYQALALEKLGQTDRPRELFQELIDTGTNQVNGAPDAKPLANANSPDQQSRVADAHYLTGLGQLGLSNQDAARQEFSLALKARPDHLAAKMALNDMTP
jgi:tetratricopeptide (TPR) repeat protein